MTNYESEFLLKIQDYVFVYLINGIRLVGSIEYFDDHVLLLKNGSSVQLVFKHAIATIQSATDEKDKKHD